MKKLYFLPALLAAGAFTLASCSSDDDLNGGQTGKLDGAQYMNVSVITGSSTPNGAKVAGTRADDYDYQGGGTYHDGSNTEGHLNNVRFYFFDADGNPVAMNSYSNQTSPATGYDPTSLSSADNYVQAVFADNNYGSNPDHQQTIERRYTSLVFNPVNGVVPAQTVAVANTGSLSSQWTANSTLANLQNGTASATTTTFYNSNHTDFAMSSSIYSEANGNASYSASCSGKIGTDPNNLSPVDVYVERIAAKVLAAKGGDDATKWTHVVKGTDGNYTTTSEATEGSKDAYVLYDGTARNDHNLADANGTHSYRMLAVIEGWGLADEMESAYIFKNIQNRTSDKENWIDATNPLGFAFSNTNLHRSYWETTPATTDHRKNHSWNDYTSATDAITALNSTNTESDSYNPAAKYTFPNTPTNDMYKSAIGSAETDADKATNANKYWNQNNAQTRLTKLLVAATLLYSDDNGQTYKPATICQYGGVNYLGEDQLKTAIANRNDILVGVRNKANGDTPAGEIKWYTLDPDYLSIVDQNVNNDQNGDKQYKEIASIDENAIKTGLKVTDAQEIVYAKGTINNSEQATITTAWYTQGNNNNGLTNANDQLKDQTFIIWNGGKTYYYTTIRHLAPTTGSLGSYGVVRNHEYRLAVTSFGGFGTAVYNPAHTIIPEIPSSSNTYMSARVNVLSWRVVNQNVDFDATK